MKLGNVFITKWLFILNVGDSKIHSSIGDNLKLLIDRPDGNYCFRLQKDRIYYVRWANWWYILMGMIQNSNVSLTKLNHHFRENIMKKATNVARENLVSLGTCFGKMTKSGKFRLHITALDFLAPYAKVSIQFFGSH